MSEPLRIGFIGAGKMATALARGWLTAGLTTRESCLASEPLPSARERFASQVGVRVTADNSEVVRHATIIVLAVKPQSLPEVLSEVKDLVGQQHLIVSIAAGVTLAKLAAGLGETRRLIRVMPNTACQVHAGAAAYSGNPAARPGDLELVDRLFNVVGRAVAVDETLLDVVTGLSGSGPAFVYTVIESLADGGVLMGLPRETALTLAAQTVLGAAKMALESAEHIGELRDQVTSPGGTTIAGLHALEKAGVRAGLIDAVAAATRRSRELGAD